MYMHRTVNFTSSNNISYCGYTLQMDRDDIPPCASASVSQQPFTIEVHVDIMLIIMEYRGKIDQTMGLYYQLVLVTVIPSPKEMCLSTTRLPLHNLIKVNACLSFFTTTSFSPCLLRLLCYTIFMKHWL